MNFLNVAVSKMRLKHVILAPYVGREHINGTDRILFKSCLIFSHINGPNMFVRVITPCKDRYLPPAFENKAIIHQHSLQLFNDEQQQHCGGGEGRSKRME